ncbi:hypothetical protein DER45DRAFT_599032 [Fusarium avenaceum]|nr:hypothetical protein DER45DRAFT_599032 [Fusarium avenaceum]
MVEFISGKRGAYGAVTEDRAVIHVTYSTSGNLDSFANSVSSGHGVISSQTGVQSFSGQLWGISGSPHCAEEHPTGYENVEGFFGFLASSSTEEPTTNLQNGNTWERDLSSILQEQCEGTARSLSTVNSGSQDDNLPEMLTETQSEGIGHGQPDALIDLAETFSDNVYYPSCCTGSLTPPQDPISFAQGPESNQETVTSPASCINPDGCHGQSPEPEVPGTTEEPSSPMGTSIDVIDLTLESDETPTDTATPNTNSATSRTADPAPEDLPLMPNGMNRRTESSRSERRNQQKRKRCYEEDVQSFPEEVTVRVILVNVEKESREGFMETVEFIRHKSRKWKAKGSNEECIPKLQKVVSFKMMVQGGSFGRINIHKSEDANTYKETEPLMEYMVVLSKYEAEKVLDDPEKSLGTRCHLLQEQNRSKAPQVA